MTFLLQSNISQQPGPLALPSPPIPSVPMKYIPAPSPDQFPANVLSELPREGADEDFEIMENGLKNPKAIATRKFKEEMIIDFGENEKFTLKFG